jgi:hypothetical protein
MSLPNISIFFDRDQRPEIQINADAEGDQVWLTRWIEDNFNGGWPKGSGPEALATESANGNKEIRNGIHKAV